MVKRWGCTKADVEHPTTREAEAEGEGSDQVFVVWTVIPSDDHRFPFTGHGRLTVRQRFSKHAHEGRCQGSVDVQVFNGFLFFDRFKRGPASNTVGSEEGIAHVLHSPMLTLCTVYTRDGDVGANHAVATQDHAGIGDAVATECTPFAEDGSEFTQAAGDALAVDSQVHLASVVAKVAEFRTCSQVDILSEYGIPNVVEMRGFCTRKQD